MLYGGGVVHWDDKSCINQVFLILLTKSDLEDAQEKNRSMQVILDNSYK